MAYFMVPQFFLLVCFPLPVQVVLRGRRCSTYIDSFLFCHSPRFFCFERFLGSCGNPARTVTATDIHNTHVYLSPCML